ncbi:RluA family pseudouridine synthase [Thalassotalea ganghwensis]
MIKVEKHITVESREQILIDILACHSSLSRQQLKNATVKGAVWLTRGTITKRIRRLKKELKVNDVVHLYYDEKVLHQTPSPAILIADENDYSIWYKPYGMLSQGSKWSDHCTIARWAETHLSPQRPAYIVHRLDRAATGLIIIAHTKSAAKLFSRLFEQRNIKKCYQIICHGKVPIGRSVTILEPIDDKPATSHFTSIAYDSTSNLSLIDVDIETGRKHQIRKHAAFIDHPVYGDRLYGGQLDNDNLQLCAVSLSFECPIEKANKSFELPATLRPSLTKIAGQNH